jgi:transposase-like protein
MEGHLLMSRKELHRKSVLEGVAAKRLTLKEASRRMGLTYRQTLRVYARFVEDGDAGLVHRRRGQPSNRAYPARFRDKVLKRYRERYKDHDVGPTLAAEKLAEEGLVVDHETLRRWLLKEGDWKKRRKRKTHRSRRERKAHFGELVQMDGSPHAWFGPRRPHACLMNMVDDATNIGAVLIDEEETTEAAMRLLWKWIEAYGIPMALYTDRKNVFVTDREPTMEEQLAGEEPRTAFGQACYKLGIEIIRAYSPQAKGRVERVHGTYQDRLVKELALRGITRIETANTLLQNGFTADLNAKFARPPLEQQDYHRPLPKGLKLDDVFCFEQHRTVQNDWTIRHENRYYQIRKDNTPLPKPKDKIVVRTHLDGRIRLLYRNKDLDFRPITLTQRQQHEMPRPKRPAEAKTRTQEKNTHHHPWRQNCTLMQAEPSRKVNR